MFVAAAGGSDIVPGPVQTRPVVLQGGDVYTVSGDVHAGGVVVFDEGRIVYAGPADDAPEVDDAETFDVVGKRVYPGLFDGLTDLGLVEIPAVRATRDQSEAGDVNPNAMARVSVNPDSTLIPVTRANGVLLAHVRPSGGIVSGQGAVMTLDGWTYEQMTVSESTGILLNWPNMLPRQGWFVETSVEEQLRRRDENLRRIEDIFDRAERYRQAKRAGDAIDFDARMEAMLPLLNAEIPLVVSADEASQMRAAVAFARRRNVDIILVGGAESGKVIDLLAEEGVPVILDGVHRLPPGRDADYDEPFTLPARLHEAGVKFAIAGNRGPNFARNLPYHAATAAAFGLPQDEALAAITLRPAEILGVAGDVGSLEAGKSATLFVADGDILETPTQVTHAWIHGRRVDLTSRHTRLNDKYRQRLEQEPVE